MSITIFKILGNARVHHEPGGWRTAAALEGGRRPTGRAAAVRARKLLCFGPRTFTLLKSILSTLTQREFPRIAPKTRSVNPKAEARPSTQSLVRTTYTEGRGTRYCTSPPRWSEIITDQNRWGDLAPHDMLILNNMIEGILDA